VQRRRALLSSSTLATIAAEGAGGTAVELGATFASKASGNENIGDTSSSAASGAEGEAESTEAESMSMSIALEASLSGDGTARSVGRAAGSHLAESFASADAARIAELGVEAISVSGFGGAAAGGEDAMTEASLHADTMIARTAECCDDGMTPFASSSADASTEGLVDGFATNSAFDAEGEAESVSEVRGSAGSLLEVAAVRGTGDTDIPFDAEAIASSATSGQVETYGTGDSSASYGDLFQSMVSNINDLFQRELDGTIEVNQLVGDGSLADSGGLAVAEAEALLGGRASALGMSGVFLGGDTGGTVAGRVGGNTNFDPVEGSISASMSQIRAGGPVLAVATGYSGPGYAQTIGSGFTTSNLYVEAEARGSPRDENILGTAESFAEGTGIGVAMTTIDTSTEGVDSGSIGEASSMAYVDPYASSFAGSIFFPNTAFSGNGYSFAGTTAESEASGDSFINFDSATRTVSNIRGQATEDGVGLSGFVGQENTAMLEGRAIDALPQALELGLESGSLVVATIKSDGTYTDTTLDGMSASLLEATGRVQVESMVDSMTDLVITDIPEAQAGADGPGIVFLYEVPELGTTESGPILIDDVENLQKFFSVLGFFGLSPLRFFRDIEGADNLAFSQPLYQNRVRTTNLDR